MAAAARHVLPGMFRGHPHPTWRAGHSWFKRLFTNSSAPSGLPFSLKLEKLQELLQGTEEEAVQEKQAVCLADCSVLLFPGQGSQHPGMAGPQALQYPSVRAMFEAAERVLGYDLLHLCQHGPQEQLDKTLHSQPALYVTSLAAAERLCQEQPQSKKKKINTISATEILPAVMASRQDKCKKMSAPQVLLAVMASSASTESTQIPRTSEGSSPDPRVSTPLPPTPLPRGSTALSPIARPRNQSTPVSRARERSPITCPKPKPSPIPRSRDLPSSSLSPEGQLVLDSNDEEKLISDKENVCCIPNIEASTSSVHLWRDICSETGVSEDSEHAHQMVMAHIWQFQKKLCETQKESLRSLQELKASVGINGKRSRSKQIRASPETANLVHRGYKYYMEHHNMSPWNINEDPLGGSNGSISSKIMEYVRGANPNTSHEEVNAAIKMYWGNLRRKKKEENI